jgi:glycerol-3-phosphate cytidylyltransferase
MNNVGFTTGVFDLFHIGHLNLLKNAKRNCDQLHVGVSSDELVYHYKGKRPIIPEADRLEIVRSIKEVDEAFLIHHRDKKLQFHEVNYNTLFVGDDWKGDPVWVELEDYLSSHGAQIHYFGYTQSVSTTKLTHILESLQGDEFKL